MKVRHKTKNIKGSFYIRMNGKRIKVMGMESGK